MREIIVTCRELVSNNSFADDVDLQRYDYLHEDVKEVVKQWIQLAWEQRNCKPEKSFEPFIYAWFAFNVWAACVTGKDKDFEWKQALSINPTLCSYFSDKVNDPNSSVSELAREFYELWPVFRADEIRKKGVRLPGQRNLSGQPTLSRQETVKHYFKLGIEKYAPQCWKEHEYASEKVPLDWPHTLAVLYRVRCNLFHGEKGIKSEMDQKIVSKAFRLLVHFFYRRLILIPPSTEMRLTSA